jgi:hypothetical protein
VLLQTELISECAELPGVGGYISSSHVVNANVTINSNTLIHKLHVVDDEAVSCDALLSLDFLNLPGMVLTHTKTGSTLQYEPPLSHNNEPSTIESILNEFKGMATTGNKIPTSITIGEFKIKLTSDKEIKYRPYRLLLSASERDTLKNIIQDLINNSIIQPSHHPMPVLAY